MRFMRTPRIILVLGIFVLGFAIINTLPVSAQVANAAQGMQLSPPSVELNAARGNTYTIKINVLNPTASDLMYSSSVEDFGAPADESGTPTPILDSKLPATASVRTWISAVPVFTLRGGKSIDITAQITIPNNAEPGGHYGILRFSGVAPQVEGTGVGLTASAGVLILIRVDGAITEKADLASFYTSPTQNGKQSSFFENAPVWFIVRVKNEGNIHVKPVGNIEIRDMFGGLVKNLPVNNDKSNVLPSSIRRFDEAQYNNPWMVGLYTANLTLGYGTNGQAITNTISFWVIPYKIILAALLIFATVIYILSRLIRVYNRHIIEKAKNENKNKKSKQGKKKD